jgi:hypothetical protein
MAKLVRNVEHEQIIGSGKDGSSVILEVHPSYFSTYYRREFSKAAYITAKYCHNHVYSR